jgi:LmbE family N-acetylglucosaminyl deacetylase
MRRRLARRCCFVAHLWVQKVVIVRDSLAIVWAAQRLCVISPHPDDDVLGCGGTLALAWAGGAALRILYVTDGAASHPGSLDYPPERLRDVREDEAKGALKILGVPETQLHFLRQPDGRLARAGAAASELASCIAAHVREFAPTMVFSPWIRDGHGDHVAASLAVRRALAQTRSAAALYEYPVWLDELGTTGDAPHAREAELVSVDVRAFRALKARAIRAHRSQLGEVIRDAATPFVLPTSLLQRSDVASERFFRIVAPGAEPQ